MFSILDGRTEFYQWDKNRKLIVNDSSIKEVHFANCLCSTAKVVETYTDGAVTLVDVPNVLLTEYQDIKVWGYDGEATKHAAVFEVARRTKPDDYVYTEEELKEWEKIKDNTYSVITEYSTGGVGTTYPLKPNAQIEHLYLDSVKYQMGEGNPSQTNIREINAAPTEFTIYWSLNDREEQIAVKVPERMVKYQINFLTGEIYQVTCLQEINIDDVKVCNAYGGNGIYIGIQISDFEWYNGVSAYDTWDICNCLRKAPLSEVKSGDYEYCFYRYKDFIYIRTRKNLTTKAAVLEDLRQLKPVFAITKNAKYEIEPIKVDVKEEETYLGVDTYELGEEQRVSITYSTNTNFIVSDLHSLQNDLSNSFNESVIRVDEIEDRLNSYKGEGVHAEQYNKGIAIGDYSHAEGSNITDNDGEEGEYTFVYTLPNETQEREYTVNGATAYGHSSHAEGSNTLAYGHSAHAEGCATLAYGGRSHAEGTGCQAIGARAHAEGDYTIASGINSHAEGSRTKATKTSAHAEGSGCEANGYSAHAEGAACKANGDYSHAEGGSCESLGMYSHAEGFHTIAASAQQSVQGRYNIADTVEADSKGKYSARGKYAHIIGNGSSSTPSNAHTVDWSGNGWYAGTVEATAIILTSPNKTRYKITVADDGTLKTQKV